MKRVRDISERTWTILGFSILLGFVWFQSIHGRQELNSNLRTGCARTSERAAVMAAGFTTLSKRVALRDAPGDAESARNYQATADGALLTIPMVGYEPRIAEVALSVDHGRLVYRLTPAARELQHAGCRSVYPRPSPLP